MTTWRTRFFMVSSGRASSVSLRARNWSSALEMPSAVTQVGHTENLGGFLAGGATLSVLAIVELVRSTGIDHKQLEVVLVEVELLLGDVLQRGQLGRQSSSSAWPAVQRMEAFWSRPPVEAPAISFSDLMAALMRVTRPASESP